ncbi:MAG: hypothetical protein K8R90_09355 [Candidatus Cloacimonetes bacterium]|nr:hypothetical protein [Candidatus Cloacimonadota bacterium]
MSQTISELLASLDVQDEDLAKAITAWLESALAEQGSIPKSRFDEVISQRNELRQNVEELDSELEALRRQSEQQQPAETQRLTDENAKLRKQLTQLMLDQWAHYAAWFQPGHPHHDKAMRIADDFHLPAKGKQLSLEDIEHNLQAIRPYLKADFFAAPGIIDSTPPAARAPQHHAADLRRIFKTFGG